MSAGPTRINRSDYELSNTPANPGFWLRFRCGPVLTCRQYAPAPVLAKAPPEARLGARAVESVVQGRVQPGVGACRRAWQISGMGIFDRMGKVISANFNGLVDGLQDPAKVGRADAARDARADPRRAAEVVSAVAAEKQLRGKLDELDAAGQKWASRAELAVKNGDDELAREALVQKKRVTGERGPRRGATRRAARRRSRDEGRARAHGAKGHRARAPQGHVGRAGRSGQGRERTAKSASAVRLSQNFAAWKIKSKRSRRRCKRSASWTESSTSQAPAA